jgi:hypothetical protein
MRVVIDVGCYDHGGGDRSIEPLVEEFRPDWLIGYDPLAAEAEYNLGATRVTVRPWAAWLHYGTVRFVTAGYGSHVNALEDEQGGAFLKCVDLPTEIERHAEDGAEIILKLDCEMAEYELLPALQDAGLDMKIRVLLVEWHCPYCLHGEWSHNARCQRPHGHNARRLEIEETWQGDLREWAR